MKILSFVMAGLLSVTQSVNTEEYAQFESAEFEQQIIDEISNYDAEQNQLLMDRSIGGAVCQGMKDYSVFDLKKLALFGRDKKKTIVKTTVNTDTYLVHRICSYTFVPTNKELGQKVKINDPSCKKLADAAPGNMYLVKNTGGKCLNSFKYAKFDADIEHDKKTGKVTTVNWDLKYKSLQKCHADTSKDMEIKIKGTCVPDAKKSTLKVSKAEKCKVSIDYKSKDACIAATFPLQKYMAKLAPFAGAILIIGGLACCLAGSKFVPMAISFLMFLAGSGGIFMVGYNFLPPTTVKMWSLIVLLVVAVLLGVLLGWVAYKFLQAWSVSILGGWMGIVLVMFILKMAGVKNQNITLGCALLAAVGFGILANKYKSGIKRIGTAFIGAFIVIRGIASYAGGFPSEFGESKAAAASIDYASKENIFVYAYFAGFIVLGIFGFWFQKKFLELPEEDDDKYDEMKGEDEAKVCGCF